MMCKACLLAVACLPLAALAGCGKSRPAANQVAAAPDEQVVTGTVVYQQTGPATFSGSSGIPGPVGAAMPPANAASPAAGTLAATPATSAPANTGTLPAGPATSTSTAGASTSPGTAQPTVPPATPPPTAPPTGTATAPQASATASAPAATSGSPAAEASAGGGPRGPAQVVPSGNLTALAAAVNQWRAQGVNLAGAKRLDDKPVLAGYSWMTHLLPYVGHEDLYKKFDFTKGWHEKENIALTCEEIPAFLDPMNGNRHMKVIGQKKSEIGPAFTHYVGMAGVEDSRNLVAAELPRSDPRAGIFGYNDIARPEQITDGMSNTIMLISAGKIVGPWASGGGATVRGARAPYFDEITGFGSGGDPGGGALVAMADGSVKRISKEIDPAVFRAMCTIHGAESVDLSTHAKFIRPQ